MQPITRDNLWNLLLDLRDVIKNSHEPVQNVAIGYGDPGFTIEINNIPVTGKPGTLILITGKKNIPEAIGKTVFHVDENCNVSLIKTGTLKKEDAEFLLLYLPYCFWAQKIKLEKRAKAVVHFAQSLDGRIATLGGSSRWISNDEDLIHAHRMRALCDAVLIGAGTLITDKPALTVRHVAGPDPVKIVVGNSEYDFSSVLANNGRVIFVTGNKDCRVPETENICIVNGKAYISPSAILEALYAKDIRSVYVEGGSVTASFFMADLCVDLLQLFMSPRILGSGKNNFNLPSISRVDQSVNFRNVSYTRMGDGILFQGNLLNGEKA